jgi:cytochrome bd-type quinol oxidase subunit 2
MPYEWNPKETSRMPERREKPDLACRIVTVTALLSWATVPFVILFLQMALPSTNVNVFMTMLGMTSRSSGMNANMMWLTIGLLLFIVVLSLTGFLFNSKRMRRKTDKYNKFNIAVGIAALLSVLGLFIVYLPSLLGL